MTTNSLDTHYRVDGQIQFKYCIWFLYLDYILLDYPLNMIKVNLGIRAFIFRKKFFKNVNRSKIMNNFGRMLKGPSLKSSGLWSSKIGIEGHKHVWKCVWNWYMPIISGQNSGLYQWNLFFKHILHPQYYKAGLCHQRSDNYILLPIDVALII